MTASRARRRPKRYRPSPYSKPLVFLLCLLPFLWIVWRGFSDQLGADPVDALLEETGIWTLRFLLIVLSLGILRQHLPHPGPGRFRRMLGLFTFFYASLHFLVYLGVDAQFYWPQITEDIVKRPYITVAFAAWLILLALAVTSSYRLMQRWGSGWFKLHKLSYAAGALGVLHFYWLVKADLREPLIYAGLFAIVFLHWRWRRYQEDRAMRAVTQS